MRRALIAICAIASNASAQSIGSVSIGNLPPAPAGTAGAVFPGTQNSTTYRFTASQIFSASGGAPLNSPAFTGAPTAPTPASSDNSNRLATTAFVNSLNGGYVLRSGDTMTGLLNLNGGAAGSITPPNMTYTDQGKSGYSFNATGNLFSAHDIYNMSQGVSGDPSAPSFYDALEGVAHQSSGSTLGQVTGVAGYAVNDAANVTYNANAVGLFGTCVNRVSNASCFGLNTLLQDGPTRAVNSLTGQNLVNELDFNVMSPNTEVLGLSIGGNSLAQPGVADGFLCNSLGNGFTWGGCFITLDGVAQNGLVIGARATSGTNINSQPIVVGYYDGTGTRQQIIEQVTGGKYLSFSGFPSSGGIGLNSGDLLIAGAGQGIDIGNARILDRSGLYMQPASTGNSQPSEPVSLYGTNSSGSQVSANIQLTAVGVLSFNTSAGSGYSFVGTVGANGFSAGGSAGVSCSGAPTSAFAVTNGIVTHC